MNRRFFRDRTLKNFEPQVPNFEPQVPHSRPKPKHQRGDRQNGGRHLRKYIMSRSLNLRGHAGCHAQSPPDRRTTNFGSMRFDDDDAPSRISITKVLDDFRFRREC
jgi:hypothetical protein